MITASYAAVKGTPAAEAGYTSTPCGVCLLSIQTIKLKITTHFCTRNYKIIFCLNLIVKIKLLIIKTEQQIYKRSISVYMLALIDFFYTSLHFSIHFTIV